MSSLAMIPLSRTRGTEEEFARSRAPKLVYWRKMNSTLRAEIVTGLMLAATVLCRAQTVSPKQSCDDLLKYNAPAVNFSKAERIAASTIAVGGVPVSLPPYCLVQGVINQRTGATGRPFGIGFELRLPDSWTGRFLFQGGGGMDGVVRPATGAVPISGSTASRHWRADLRWRRPTLGIRAKAACKARRPTRLSASINRRVWIKPTAASWR